MGSDPVWLERMSLGTPAFIGVALAWSDRHPSGLALAKLGKGQVRIQETDCLVTDQEIVMWIARRSPGPSLIAIDAPIIAPAGGYIVTVGPAPGRISLRDSPAD